MITYLSGNREDNPLRQAYYAFTRLATYASFEKAIITFAFKASSIGRQV
jgi:hypothetical protein